MSISVSIFSPALEGTECASEGAPAECSGAGGRLVSYSAKKMEMQVGKDRQNGSQGRSSLSSELEGAELVHPGLSWSKQAEIERRRRGIDNWLCFLTVQEAFSELEKLNTVPHPGKSLCPSLAPLGGLL